MSLKVIGVIIMTTILTIITQVGGLIYLLSVSFHPLIDRKTYSRSNRILLKVGTFIILYSICTAFLVPILAKQRGRVPMPVFSDGPVKPLTLIYPFLNRHYVLPALYQTIDTVAHLMQEQHPGTKVCYIDGGFPFNAAPIFPQLSRRNPNSLDLAFCYRDRHGNPANRSPSFFGYGACIEPRREEQAKLWECRSWKYNIWKTLTGGKFKSSLVVDGARTRNLITTLYESRAIGKIYLEPHLILGFQLLFREKPKITFQGCESIRHDDHIEILLDTP